MRYQEMMIEATKVAAADAFKYAKAVPADKLDWRPMDAGRSVLDICKELAVSPHWATVILQGGQMPEFAEEAMAEFANQTASWTTVEIIEEVAAKNLEEFYRVVREFPDERLGEKYTLPFDGGQEVTMAENIGYPLWNFSYHQGQIAYIQTLYGDHKMYW